MRIYSFSMAAKACEHHRKDIKRTQPSCIHNYVIGQNKVTAKGLSASIKNIYKHIFWLRLISFHVHVRPSIQPLNNFFSWTDSLICSYFLYNHTSWCYCMFKFPNWTPKFILYPWKCCQSHEMSQQWCRCIQSTLFAFITYSVLIMPSFIYSGQDCHPRCQHKAVGREVWTT